MTPLIDFECCPPLRTPVCLVCLRLEDETWAKKVPFHLRNWHAYERFVARALVC